MYMKSIYTHSRKDQIVINISTDEFAAAYFKIFEEKLVNSYIFLRQVEGNLLRFRGSIFRFAWNGWNLFNTISSGEIEFTEEGGYPFIRHKIFFNELLYIALIFNLIPIFTFKFEPNLSVLVFIGIWLFYAINYFIGIFRFNSYISETLIKVNIEHGYKFKTDIPAFG
jgi:hypothetical protein